MKKIILFVLALCLCFTAIGAVFAETAVTEAPAAEAPATEAPKAEMTAEELYQAGFNALDTEDYAKALEYFKAAADFGHADAIREIENLYGDGFLVEQIYNQAVGKYLSDEHKTDVYGKYDPDGTYINTVLEIVCKLKDWRYYTKKELSVYTSEITIMAATAPNEISNVIIQARDLSPYSQVPTSDSELDGWLDEMLEAVKNTLLQNQLQDVQVEISEVNVSGRIFQCISASMKTPSDSYLYQREFMYLKNNYLVFVTVTGTSFDETDEILSRMYLR